MANIDDIRSLDLFSDCHPDELAFASSLLTSVDVAPDRRLIAEGQPPQQFLIIAEGEALVSRQIEGTVTPVATLRTGSFVGEMGLLERTACSATVYSSRQVRLLAASRAEFHHLASIPSVGRRLRTVATQRFEENHAA